MFVLEKDIPDDRYTPPKTNTHSALLAKAVYLDSLAQLDLFVRRDVRAFFFIHIVTCMIRVCV